MQAALKSPVRQHLYRQWRARHRWPAGRIEIASARLGNLSADPRPDTSATKADAAGTGDSQDDRLAGVAMLA